MKKTSTSRMAPDDPNRKYVTLEEKIDFRTISYIMQGLGFKLNHATARNLLQRSLVKIIDNIFDHYNIDPERRADLKKELVNSQVFQMIIQDCLDIQMEKDSSKLTQGLPLNKVYKSMQKVYKKRNASTSEAQKTNTPSNKEPNSKQ